MLVLKNYKQPFDNKYRHALISVFIFFSFTFFVYGKNIDIKSTEMYLENEVYYLDASMNIKLTDEAKKALKHGIALQIHTEFELYKIRKWLWDKKMIETKLNHRLEHQPLTENYLTIDLKTGLRRSYHDLNSALMYLNNITKMTLFNKDVIDGNNVFLARLRTFLDIKSLPTPIRPQAFFSPNWEITSDWHQWRINP